MFDDEKKVLDAILGEIKKLDGMDSNERIEIGSRLKKVIDGQGADRVAQALLDM